MGRGVVFAEGRRTRYEANVGHSTPRSTRFLLLSALCALAATLALATPAQAATLFDRARDSPVGSAPAAVAAADYDGDGVTDLAVSNEDESGNLVVSVLMGEGNGDFGAPTEYEIPPDADFQEATGIIAADFDEDGSPDLALTDIGADVGLVVLTNNGDGTFADPVDYYPPLTELEGISLVAEDFDGDGHLDVAVAFYPNFQNDNIAIYPGNGDGTFGDPAPFDTGTDQLTSIATGDFDGDGDPDLATASQVEDGGGESRVSVLPGNGDGTFGSAAQYAVGASPQSVIARDLDGDGRVDLATANAGDSTVSVLPGNGDGTFDASTGFPTGPRTQPSSVAAADFDGDGTPDLSTANTGTNTVSALIGDGNGAFGAPQTSGVGAGPLFVGAADFDGDAKSDAVTANSGSDDVSVLMNAVPPSVSAVSPGSAQQGRTVTLKIRGTGFGEGARVTLKRNNLSFGARSVTRVSPTRLEAKVSLPKYLPTGRYGVEVVNSNGGSDTLDRAFRVSGG